MMYKPKKIIREPKTRPTARQPLEKALHQLQDRMLALGSRVSRNIIDSVEMLQTQNVDQATALIISDRDINQARYHIESECLKLIATQNPIARDLRTVTAVLVIATELERINDYAKGIAKITRVIGKEPLLRPSTDFSHMALKAQGMLRRALFAFTERDVTLAYAIAMLDDEVDALYGKIHTDIVHKIMENPLVTPHAQFHLWAAHNLERTGDRALNISERVVFTVTGKLVELDDDLIP